ncbi:MAG: tyrosine recombinase [Candidatus Eisenbacteria bacterium]
MSRSRSEAHSGGEPAVPGTLVQSLEEFLFHMALVRGASPRTVEAYRSDLRILFAKLGKQRVQGPAHITPDHLRRHLIELHESGRRPASVARARSALRSYFAFLLDEGILVEDPSSELPAPRGWKRIPRALTEDQARVLIEHIHGEEPIALRDRALMECAYGTGARVSELLGLRLQDCLWDEQLVRYLGKGRRVRLVPIGDPASKALAAYTEKARPRMLLARHARGDEPEEVFLNARGGCLTRMGFWKILRKRATEAGLAPAGVHPHLLRHSYATHMLHHGASLRVVQELLGHSRLATTQIYTSVDDAYLRSIHERCHPRG